MKNIKTENIEVKINHGKLGFYLEGEPINRTEIISLLLREVNELKGLVDEFTKSNEVAATKVPCKKRSVVDRLKFW